MSIRSVGLLIAAGWLAQLLAREDSDIRRGVELHEAGDHAAALEAYAEAEARLGDRPEIAYNRGLSLLAQGDTEGATAAFERALDSEDSQVLDEFFLQRVFTGLFLSR